MMGGGRGGKPARLRKERDSRAARGAQIPGFGRPVNLQGWRRSSAWRSARRNFSGVSIR